MKKMKNPLTLVWVLVLLLALAPAACADLEAGVPDREFQNSENNFVAAIYDDGNLFTEEEMDRLLEPMGGCTGWASVFIVTDDRSADEITKDPAFFAISTGTHLVLVFGRDREDMRVQWDFSSDEDEVLALDEVAGLFGGAKGGYLETGSAFEAANEFMGDLLTALQESGVPAGTMQDTDYYQFRTLEELKRILDMDIGAEREIFVTDLEDRDSTLEEDLVIPAGKKVFFGEGTLTVAPEVTVTVEEGAGLFFYGLDVQGTVINNGDLVQCEQLNGGEQLPILIEGKVINRDWFSFYNIAGGIERIENQEEGRLFSSKEGKRVSPGGSSPSPTPKPSQTPSKKPSGSTGGKKSSSMITPLVLIIMLVVTLVTKNSGKLKKVGQSSAGSKNAGTTILQSEAKRPAAPSSASGSRNIGAAGRRPPAQRPEAYRPEVYRPEAYNLQGDYTAYDNRRRMKQLDDWLKNGLIDKDEYRKLKDRYSGK